MPNRDDLGDGIEGDPNAMSAGIPFDGTEKFIQLDMPQIKILEVSIMDPHGLRSRSFEPQTHRARIMSAMFSRISLAISAIQQIQGFGHILKRCLEMGHGHVMALADIAATRLTDPLTDRLSPMIAVGNKRMRI